MDSAVIMGIAKLTKFHKFPWQQEVTPLVCYVTEHHAPCSA